MKTSTLIFHILIFAYISIYVYGLQDQNHIMRINLESRYQINPSNPAIGVVYVPFKLRPQGLKEKNYGLQK